MSEKQMCCATSYSGSSFFGHKCGKTANVERDGKHYCGIHDPVRRSENQQAKREQWRAEYQAKQKQWAKEKADADEQKRRADCYPDLLGALQGLMQVESRGRVMPAGQEWDNARAAIKKATS